MLLSAAMYKHLFSGKIKVSSNVRQYRQLTVLIAGNANHSMLQPHYHNIIAADKHDDILALIKTTQFDLILLDLEEDCSEFFNLIKASFSINDSPPVIGMLNQPKEFRTEPLKFDGWVSNPITEELLDEIVDCWQTKALDYIRAVLAKTKNNQRLTLTIFEKLFEEIPLQLAGIKNALQDKQYDLAREITHRLNGSASFCGLTDIQQAATAVESHLLNNNHTDIYQHFLTLEQCCLNLTRYQKFILTDLGRN